MLQVSYRPFTRIAVRRTARLVTSAQYCSTADRLSEYRKLRYTTPTKRVSGISNGCCGHPTTYNRQRGSGPGSDLSPKPAGASTAGRALAGPRHSIRYRLMLLCAYRRKPCGVLNLCGQKQQTFLHLSSRHSPMSCLPVLRPWRALHHVSVVLACHA